MTRAEAIDWVNAHDDGDTLDRDELDAAFVAIVGRKPDDDETISDRWSAIVVEAD